MRETFNFDKKDRELLRRINEVIDHGPATSEEQEAFNTSLHPHGIQNMVTTHEVRMAMAVINLLQRLNSIEGMNERLSALKTLHEEVLYSAQTPFKFNTARVLIQIMKDIVRSRGNEEEQLRLIHDFQKVAAGNPRIVRSFLTRYYLLEMPEEWNQKTMDDHVHDSNTMGRKNPTYLVMDARVKGIRRLSVVYYNYVDPHAVYELFEAARIMEISVRLGIKYKAKFDDRYVEILWTPRGFTDTKSVMDFLQEPDVVRLMAQGRKVELWARERVLETLAAFNEKHARAIEKEYGLKLPKLSEEQFRAFIGTGQTSLVRLAEFTHKSILPVLEARAEEIQEALGTAAENEKADLNASLAKLDELTSAHLYQNYLRSSRNPEIKSLSLPQDDDRPELLNIDIASLLSMLKSVRANSRATLLTSRLSAVDVLELLWDTEGAISHLEVFNMKEWKLGSQENIQEINDLQHAINERNVIKLKRLISSMLALPEVQEHPQKKAVFTEILENIPLLLSFYRRQPLGSRFGTDSTTLLGSHFGMGLAVPETLPASAQKMIGKKSRFSPFSLPLKVPVKCVDVYSENEHSPGWIKWLKEKTGCSKLGRKHERVWEAGYAHAALTDKGNIITLGGETPADSNGFVHKQSEEKNGKKQGFAYTNTTLLNILKVSIGFVPAFFTFMMTQNWWVLAWFGALIWFSITGVRNIIQALIAAGGFRQGMRINWTQVVNWSRVSDSLMYTGMSVVLLEGFTRNILLGHWLGITVDKAPLLVFSIIALANGLYISSHNIFRGFPKTAVVGNLFRSVLAIPVAMVYNFVLAMIIPILTGGPAAAVLVPAAAIVSKFASDTVAGVIESIADRQNNYRLRTSDFKMGVKGLFDCFTKLELEFPKNDILSLLSNPSEFINMISMKSKAMEIQCIVISLDLMYIWYYQPCARYAFMSELRKMSAEERLVFVRFQQTLSQYQEVSRLFLDGMLGQKFSKALSFYLENYKDYLQAIEEIRVKADGGDIVQVSQKQEKLAEQGLKQQEPA